MLLITVVTSANAQVMHITGNVYKTMKQMAGSGSGKMPLSVTVYVFDNKKDAAKQASLYRSAARQLGSTFSVESNDQVKPDYEGHFEADVSPNGALLVINDYEVKVINISSKLEYDIAFTNNNNGILIDQVNVSEKRKGVNFVELPPIDDGPSLHWNVTMSLPPYYMTTHRRLIFQPIAIDCQTEDTLQYLEPIVYEGDQYHKNQIKRKSFDYNRNDSLARYYAPDTISDSEPFVFHWESTYAKPDPDKGYKWISTLLIEDYTHVLVKDDDHQGTCNSRKPWKMLDVSMAKKEIELNPDYYELARAKLRQVPRDLQLTFIVGKDELTGDTINKVLLKQMVEELRSYGRSLMNLTVQGTASPEGDINFNTKLANSRARKALQIIGSSIKSAGLQVKDSKVYSWNDVADSLQERGQNLEADEMRKYAQSNDLKGIARMMVANPIIEKIMQNQRVMKCTYTIRLNKVLDPKEVVWAYYNDPDYKEGGGAVFSNGDYYNLFQEIKDSAELRKLTYKAYKENSVRKTAKYSPFAAYLANRVACYMIVDDSINTKVLAPFIDLRSGLNVSRPISFDNSYMYTVNRKELVANQAIMYFRASKLAEASYLAAKLPNTDEYRDIKMFTDLETLYFKGNKTPEEQQRAETALAYVLNSSQSNNVVLNFELAPELGHTYADMKPLVDSLPDSNPRKWYMEGVIAAHNPDVTGDNFMELVEKYGAEEALKMQDDPTPSFLAYFQHSFDMNPTYLKYYVTDANVDDEVRKKYPYDAKKVDQYRKKFESLMATSKKTDNAENANNAENAEKVDDAAGTGATGSADKTDNTDNKE